MGKAAKASPPSGAIGDASNGEAAFGNGGGNYGSGSGATPGSASPSSTADWSATTTAWVQAKTFAYAGYIHCIGVSSFANFFFGLGLAVSADVLTGGALGSLVEPGLGTAAGAVVGAGTAVVGAGIGAVTAAVVGCLGGAVGAPLGSAAPSGSLGAP